MNNNIYSSVRDIYMGVSTWAEGAHVLELQGVGQVPANFEGIVLFLCENDWHSRKFRVSGGSSLSFIF
ncbi:MAG: hypothetical protein ACKPKO_05105, partial [Candidatus Fonsibacter sp.]